MPAPVCFAALAAIAASQGAESPSDEASRDIIVTGERVPRTLRETSSSVAVINEAEIEANGANRVDQILSLIPNVQLGNGSQGPTIRGLDTTGPLSALPAFLGGNRPRTTVIVDGRPVSYNEFVFGTFPVWDVERLEVFRTPQTTTQGQNSIAGAIFVNTNDPSAHPEFRERGIIGDFRTRQISAVASAPIMGEDVAFRVAGDFRYSRTTSDIRDVMEDADPNHDVFGLLRAKLLLTPSSRTRLTLTYVHSQSQMPQTVGVTAPFGERRDNSPIYGIFRINVDSLTAVVRHDLSDDLTADLLFTTGDSKARRLARANFGQTTNAGRDWSAEATVNWSPEGPLRVVGGASHTHARLKQFINLSLLSGSVGRFRDWQDSTGVFADASIKLTERATVTAGLRYQRDRQKRRGALTATSFQIPVDFVGKFDAWLPKFTVAYDFTPGLRVGAMVQKAYNPGGTTIRVDTASRDDFRAETLWDYEIFARAEFAGGRATAEANVFYYDMRDAQRSEGIIVRTPSGLPAGFANLFNVPKARSYGAEGQLNWRFDKSLSAKVAVGLLGTKFIRSDTESAAFEGNEFDRAPHLTGSLAIDWKPTDRARISAQVRHHSPYFTDPENSPELRIGGGTIMDARAEYQIGGVSIFGQVRNLFDEFRMRDFFSETAGEAEDPRTVAIGLEARF
jgi:iron complex outermembrane recepter protein